MAVVGKCAGFTLKPIVKPVVSISRITGRGASPPLSMQLTPNVALGITAGVKLFYIAQVYLNPDMLSKRLLKGSDELLKNPTFVEPFRLLQRMVATILLAVLSIYAYLYSAGTSFL